jgi:hypothetical protein
LTDPAEGGEKAAASPTNPRRTLMTDLNSLENETLSAVAAADD